MPGLSGQAGIASWNDQSVDGSRHTLFTVVIGMPAQGSAGKEPADALRHPRPKRKGDCFDARQPPDNDDKHVVRFPGMTAGDLLELTAPEWLLLAGNERANGASSP